MAATVVTCEARIQLLVKPVEKTEEELLLNSKSFHAGDGTEPLGTASLG